MQVEIKEIEPCQLSVHYTADAGEILEKRGQILQSFKKAPVPGFRPGKGSLDAIKIHYRNQIEESLKRALAEDAYHNTIFEKKLKPHGAPRFTSLLMADGKFTCEFEMFTKPDFELASYKDLTFPKPHTELNSIDLVEKMLQELRVKFGDAVPYTNLDFVQIGDHIIVDYDGYVEGHKVDNFSAEGEMLTVGKNQLIDFDQNLLGMNLNETREFDLVVPENGLPSLTGKSIHFKVTLNMGSKLQPAPLDDALAIKVGKKNYLELREFLTSLAMVKVNNADKLSLNEAISHKLVEDNKFTVPTWLTVSEAKYLVYNSQLNWETMLEVDKNKYLEIAEKNVKLSLILDRIRDDNLEAQLTDQEVFDIVKQNLIQTQTVKSVDETMKEMNKTGYLQIIFSRIKDQYTLDFISKTVKLVE